MGEPGVIGIDVGGTTVKGGVVSAGGSSTSPRRRPSGPERSVDVVLDLVDDLQTDAAEAQVEVDAIGLASLGIIDEDAGIVRAASNVGWRNVPLRALVEERSGCRVALGHDVRAAGQAEAALGAGRGFRNVLFVAIGTGLAVAQVVDGQALRGETWRAGEIGQLRTTPGHGRLEDIASGRAMDGAVVEEAVESLAQVLAVVVTMVDPGVIVVGGGVAQAGAALLDPLQRRLTEALIWRKPPPLVPAHLGI
ncbi:MAG TPA: ROK family protein, partial [Acidimicrobiales bacterium]